MRPMPMTAWISGKRYSTQASTLVAHDNYWDGETWERDGRNTFLFRGPDGRFFAQHRVRSFDCTDGLHDTLEPLEEVTAIPLFWELPVKEHEFPAAFPSTDS